MEVNISNFNYNIEQIKKVVQNKEIMPVIKANGYGTYINRCIDIIKDFNYVAVACVCEGVILRNIGYKGNIFVLNQPYVEDINDIVECNLIVGISDINFVRALARCGAKVKVHIELETGMGRTGVLDRFLDIFITEIEKFSNIEVEGVYTHFSSADSDYEYTNKQIELFNKGVEKVKNRIDTIKIIHCCASNGLLNFNVDVCNMVRVGLIMYGYPSSEDTLNKIDLKPIATLVSKISYLKEVDEGFSVSYGRRFITDKKMKIATVGIGYADGVRRCLSNKGYVVVNNKRCKIIGSVCMDSFLIDVTELDSVSVGDLVYIWDNELITLEEVAKWYDTINYEVISTISDRVPRIFVKK
jgi:alanine racemase